MTPFTVSPEPVAIITADLRWQDCIATWERMVAAGKPVVCYIVTPREVIVQEIQWAQ